MVALVRPVWLMFSTVLSLLSLCRIRDSTVHVERHLANGREGRRMDQLYGMYGSLTTHWYANSFHREYTWLIHQSVHRKLISSVLSIALDSLVIGQFHSRTSFHSLFAALVDILISRSVQRGTHGEERGRAKHSEKRIDSLNVTHIRKVKRALYLMTYCCVCEREREGVRVSEWEERGIKWRGIFLCLVLYSRSLFQLILSIV